MTEDPVENSEEVWIERGPEEYRITHNIPLNDGFTPPVMEQLIESRMQDERVIQNPECVYETQRQCQKYDQQHSPAFPSGADLLHL